MRITCLLGAGATIQVEGPATPEITKAARSKSQHVIDPATGSWVDVRFIDEIAARLDSFIAPAPSHFEDIFDVLEGLQSFGRAWEAGTVERFKPRLAAFVQMADSRWFDPMWLIAAKRCLLEAVAEQVEQSISRFQPSGPHGWFRTFWSKALTAAALDIATLNYDNLLEQMPLELEDGFEASPSWSRFKPDRLLQTKKSRILHLHGSIFYGYLPHPGDQEFVDYFEDLCKYASPAEARRSWFGRSVNTAQSHEEAAIGPLITGLRKPDKLTAHPYDEYQAVFRRCIYESPCLLVVGYSFGDLYLNSIINRVLGIHGSKRRIVIVTWFPGSPDQWHYEPACLNGLFAWPNMNMLFAFGAAMNSVTPLGRSFEFQEKLVSTDGCCRIYLGGTRKSFEKYGDEILQFLLSR
jgi:hypothetical protein